MHLVSQSFFLKTLGWSLFNSLWQMAFLWLIYIIVTAAGKKYTARVRHIMAVFLLLCGSVWFTVQFFSSFYRGSESSFPGINMLTFFSTNDTIPLFNSVKQFINNALPYCSAGYLAVLMLLFIRYVQYYWHSRRLKLAGLHKAQPALRIFVDEVAQQLGIHKKVSIWLSSVADSPMTVGFFKSVILIPIATINHLTTQQVEAILLHELAHIKRNDYFLNLLVTVTNILFFFNPFSRLLIRHIRKEAENSCDDLVMQFRYDAHTYVSALLSLERTRHRQQLAMAAIGKDNQVLLERVRRIAGQKNKPQLNGSKLVLFFLVIMISFMTVVVQRPAHTAGITQVTFYAKQAFPETQRVYYNPVVLKKKMKTAAGALPVTKKYHTSNAPAIQAEPGDNDLVLVSNTDQNELNAANDISAAVLADDAEREYSIVQKNAAQAPVAVSDGYDRSYPFVPSSSFNSQKIEDTINKTRLGYHEKMANATLQKTLMAIDAVNLKKLSKEITGNGKQLNVEKLRSELRKSLSAVDWQKINNETPEAMNETDEERIKEDINMQMAALKNNKIKSSQEVMKLQQQIIIGQRKLYQENTKKLNESLKEIEQIRKKSKIVYI